MTSVPLRNLFLWFVLSSAAVLAQSRSPGVVYSKYEDVRLLLQAAGKDLPAGLKKDSCGPALCWSQWIAEHDREVRDRLAQGVDDSLVNLLLFGTSFTRRPRIRPGELLPPAGAQPSPQSKAAEAVLAGRLDDFVAGLAAPGANERLLFARSFLQREGYPVRTPEERAAVKQRLLESLGRVFKEMSAYEGELEQARAGADPTAEMALRSTLFQSRGISLDTSLQPNFALEQSLVALQRRGLLAPGAVRKVAVIGPGLDFTDKNSGYDFYPLQTIQPFALMDSLLRRGLSRKDQLEIYSFDISPMVNDHLARIRRRASRGSAYVLQLPLESQVKWDSELQRYWEGFGATIGSPAQPAAIPVGVASSVWVRAVRVASWAVLKIHSVDLNIVTQRMQPVPGGGFDLIVATNVLVYYDVFDQCLAELNVEQMLRPGGLLLSNNLLLELPYSNLRAAGDLAVAYSDRPADGDHIFWYQRR